MWDSCLKFLGCLWFWNWLYQYFLSTRFNIKQINNFISAIHSIGVVISLILFFTTSTFSIVPTFLIYWSQTYFLYDCLNYTLYSLLTVHHIIAFISLFCLYTPQMIILTPQTDVVKYLTCYMWVELSNWGMYYCSHSKQNRTTFPLFIEMISFIGLRTTMGLLYLFKYPVENYFLYYSFFGVWCASLLWGLKFVVQFMNSLQKDLNKNGLAKEY